MLGWAVLWSLGLAPVWETDLSDTGGHLTAFTLRWLGAWGVVAGQRGDGQGGGEGFLASVVDSGSGWLNVYPEVAAFRWVFPDSSGVEAWGPQPGDPTTLIRVRVDTTGTPMARDTLTLGFIPGTLARRDDTLWVFAYLPHQVQVLRWVDLQPLDTFQWTLNLPAGSAVHAVLLLPDGGVVLGGERTVGTDTEGFLFVLDRDGTIRWEDSLTGPLWDGVWGLAWLETSGEICATGTAQQDGWLGLYTPEGQRRATARIGALPPDPFAPAAEWGGACFREDEDLFFPGWRSLYGPPAGGPWIAVLREHGAVDTLPNPPEWMGTWPPGLPPVRVGPWRYLFAANRSTDGGQGVVRLALFEDTEPPEIAVFAPDSVPGESVQISLQIRDAFSGVDSIWLMYRFLPGGDTGWQARAFVPAGEAIHVAFPWDSGATALLWYVEARDRMGLRSRYPAQGVDTLFRVGVAEVSSPDPGGTVVLPWPAGGVRYRLSAPHPLEVFDPAGRRVAVVRRSGEGVIPLPPGVYLIRVGKQRFRVSVW